MERALIVSSGEKGMVSISEALAELGYEAIDSALTAESAYSMIGDEEYAVVIINAPLADEWGGALAGRVAQEALCGVILLARRQRENGAFFAPEDLGVMVLEKPVAKALLLQAVRHARACSQRMRNLKRENLRLQYKLDETRIVNRAKATLMMYLNMTEDQAHRYIEKQAMDLRITRMEVAKNVLKNYMP